MRISARPLLALRASVIAAYLALYWTALFVAHTHDKRDPIHSALNAAAFLGTAALALAILLVPPARRLLFAPARRDYYAPGIYVLIAVVTLAIGGGYVGVWLGLIPTSYLRY